MALMMPDRHYVSHGRYWGGGTNRMPLCYYYIKMVITDNLHELTVRKPPVRHHTDFISGLATPGALQIRSYNRDLLHPLA